jgi:hypothetical protein
MARKTTPYIIGEALAEKDRRGKPRTAWLWIVDQPIYGSPWHWTSDRRNATRWTGQAAAQAFADTAMAGMKASGYDVQLYLVPASGGIPVGAPTLPGG